MSHFCKEIFFPALTRMQALTEQIHLNKAALRFTIQLPEHGILEMITLMEMSTCHRPLPGSPNTNGRCKQETLLLSLCY